MELYHSKVTNVRCYNRRYGQVNMLFAYDSLAAFSAAGQLSFRNAFFSSVVAGALCTIVVLLIYILAV